MHMVIDRQSPSESSMVSMIIHCIQQPVIRQKLNEPLEATSNARSIGTRFVDEYVMLCFLRVAK